MGQISMVKHVMGSDVAVIAGHISKNPLHSGHF